MNLPMIMANYISAVFSCFAKVIILAIFSQYLAITAPFLGTIVFFLQRFYLQTSRQVRLLEIEAKAPLYTHFTESVAGASTIRAFGWESQYQERNHRFIDTSQRPAYLQNCIQYWLGFVLNVLVTILAMILIAIVVIWKDKFSAGSVGVSLIMVMSFSNNLTRLIQRWTQMESSIGAVARIKRFVAETESEERLASPKPQAEWPEAGEIEFREVFATHGSVDSEPVIQGISMSVKAKHHVAICGRSGSGKTSLILCLLQMLDIQKGYITIDGIDVGSIPCSEVRSKINVVPQDPFLMPGTVRFNIDPFNTATDEEMIQALERVGLWNIIKDQNGLNNEFELAAWSAGQRQLLCLARAMLRKSKVLILDEAMSRQDTSYI